MIGTTTDTQHREWLEWSEMSYWSKLYKAGSSLPCYGNVIAGAFAGALPELDILAMNRVVGLGLQQPITPKDIDDIVHYYYQLDCSRFFVQLPPQPQLKYLVDMLEIKGFRHYNNWTKMVRPADKPMPEVDSSLEVVKIRPGQADLYGQLIFMSFDWEDTRLVEWLAASVGLPAYHHFLVKYENKAIAAAALHVTGKYASMAFAGTLPEYRGMGAQSLLLRERILLARELGCEYIVSETAEEKPGQQVASYRNMLRFGFEQAYLRQNWIYEF